MRNFVGIVFDGKDRAYTGLAALWQLDFAGEITVHGTTVVHRNHHGDIAVDAKDTRPVFATAVGVGIGALLGVLAGPVGIAVGVAGGAAIGAAAGAALGGAVDLERADTRAQARRETGFVMGRGQSAVIADVSEDWERHLDERMQALGGVVYRRSAASLHNDGVRTDGSRPYADYLYPYAYVPQSTPPLAGW